LTGFFLLQKTEETQNRTIPEELNFNNETEPAPINYFTNEQFVGQTMPNGNVENFLL